MQPDETMPIYDPPPVAAPVLSGCNRDTPVQRRRTKGRSPTQRSLELLRKRGYLVAIVERWIPQARKRIDAFGFADLIAVAPGEILAVQTTDGTHTAARVTKGLLSKGCAAWRRAGGAVEFHGWRTLKVGKARRWQADVRRYEPEGDDDETTDDVDTGGSDCGGDRLP